MVKVELLLPVFENGEENKLIKPKAKGSGYYKFILQNLFFNALNRGKNDRVNDIFDVYAGNFSNVEAIKDKIYLSPYLMEDYLICILMTGCEFDENGNHGIVNNAFSVPDYLFLDKDNGLNSILARYKFTIAEIHL